MARIVPRELNQMLFERGAIIAMAEKAEAAFFLDRMSAYDVRMLKRDFGFDFSHPRPEAGFAFYRYNLDKALSFMKTLTAAL